MNILDIRTVINGYLVSNGILAVLIIFLWYQHHRRTPELGFWLAAYLLQFFALVLVALRRIVPDFASILAANSLGMTGFVLLYIGLERFSGERNSQRHNYLILAIFFLVHAHFTFVQPNLQARNLNASLGLILISFQFVWLMLRRVQSEMRSETLIVGIVFGLYALVAILRIYFDLINPPISDLFKSGFYDTLAMLIYQMLFVGLTFALLQMVNRRLMVVLERDVQERKLAEAALKKSEEKFSLAFHNIPDAIVISTFPEGKIIEVNESFYRITEYSPLESLGKTTLELDLWDNSPERDLFLEQIQKTGRVSNREVKFSLKSGKLVYGLISSEIFQLQETQCLLNIIHDISERKEAENTLRRQNEYLAALQETTIELISQLNLDLLLENIAKRASQLMKTSSSYLGLLDLETGRLKPRVATGALLETPLYFPEPGKGVAGIVWQTGQPLLINNYDCWPGRLQDFGFNKINSVIGVPLLQGSKVLGVLGLAYNDSSHQTFGPESVETLTQFARLATLAIENARLYQTAQDELAERKRVEQALLESDQRMSLVLKAANDGWWDCDLTTNQVFYSPKWWSILGYTPDELPASIELRDSLTHPEDEARAEEIFQNALLSGSVQYEVEYRLLHKDGHFVPVLSRGYIQRDEMKVPIRVSGMNIDLTARKQIEEELKNLNSNLEQRVIERTTQLNALVIELEAFAYSVSHDLRAPLRGIDGWSQVLLEDKSALLDEQGRQYLARVRSETQRMGHLIDDLLNLSRVTRSEMQHGPVNLSALAEEIVERFKNSQSERFFEIVIQPDLWIQGDSHLLEIALTNLLDNACKFSSTRPLAKVEFGRISLDSQQTYYVRDNGVGFDIQNAKKLFGAFQRMHRQSEFPGNGIGLATVQRIIRRHGGRIWAETQKDCGATFYFTLEEAPG